MNFDKPFWKTVLREADGTASTSRLLVTGIVAACLLWVSGLVIKNHALPNLEPVGMFISTTTLCLYGVNKVADATKNIFGTPDPKAPTG
jgi:hypothetical protein